MKNIILKTSELENNVSLEITEDQNILCIVDKELSLSFHFAIQEAVHFQCIFLIKNVSSNIDCKIFINKEEAQVSLLGCYDLNDNQEMSFTSEIHHKKEKTYASQLFKGLLKDSSSATFKGKIFVLPQSQKIESFQMNQSLLTSPLARHISSPELYIYADDVKCSHGSTTGFISNEELFYLESRGISKVKAKILLEQAYLKEVSLHIKHSEHYEKFISLF